MTFDEWMVEVDEALVDICGLTSADITDYHYADLYESEVSPEEAAQEAWENATA